MSEKTLNIGIDAEQHVCRVFGYYDPTPKTTVDGLVFKTYFGLRQYYITGGFDSRLLSLTDPKEIQQLSRQYKWSHMWDLSMLLMQALIHNIRLNPSLADNIPATAKVVWKKRGELNRNEKAWLEIVKSVNSGR